MNIVTILNGKHINNRTYPVGSPQLFLQLCHLPPELHVWGFVGGDLDQTLASAHSVWQTGPQMLDVGHSGGHTVNSNTLPTH